MTCRRVPDIELTRSSHTDEVYALQLTVCKPINCTLKSLHDFNAGKLHGDMDRRRGGSSRRGAELGAWEQGQHAPALGGTGSRGPLGQLLCICFVQLDAGPIQGQHREVLIVGPHECATHTCPQWMSVSVNHCMMIACEMMPAENISGECPVKIHIDRTAQSQQYRRLPPNTLLRCCLIPFSDRAYICARLWAGPLVEVRLGKRP